MGKTLPVPVPPADDPPPARQHDPADILALINGVLAGIGGVYISTRSALITIVAALAAVLLAAVVSAFRRQPGRRPRSEGK